ncbi:hypothetical protein GCM10010124_13990 [Pilimelia terevasa]|uniref:CYTH domain-containing protein n=1 Tax=Pilimelia terevasa TaxID=53372 RepID=A0A8J3BNW7_9ACTN|nr:hypothetical protein [Pilimelia terevasa]GGK22666.1 hypothetical protein GCM10010124_13990 [Pilimelia terevasa]
MEATLPPYPELDRDDVHIGIEHECKWELTAAEADDPAGLVEATLFPDLLTPYGRPRDYLQSALYLDDGNGSLAAAGHSLSVVVNGGGPSTACVVAFKQTVCYRGWRDGLEIRQRLAHRPGVPLRHDRSLPVAYARRLGLLTGVPRPAGVAVQRRYKRFGRTVDGTEVFCSLDAVEFGGPEVARERRSRYTCLEIEVNSPLPAALAALDGLARAIDERLGRPRDRTSKSQRGWAAERARRAHG